MVLLQALGLVHRTAHYRTAHHHAAPAAQAPHAAGVAQPWLKALFSGHTEGAECVLYDQLGQADALAAVPTVVLPDAAVIRPEPVHPAWNLAHQAAGFLARGPPSTPV